MRFPRLRGQPTEFDRSWQPRLWAVVIGLTLLAAYVIGFIVRNDEPVDVHFVFGTARVSLIWVIVLSLALGALAGLLISQLYDRRRRAALTGRE